MSDITFEFEPDPGDDITFNIGEGQEGPPGQGVPVGGTDGQVLTKTSATNYATAWEDPANGLPDQTGNDGKIIRTDGTDPSWVDLGIVIADASAKTTPADNDKFVLSNSEGSDEANRISWLDLVAALPASGGDVVGPASAVDDRIATFDGTTGKLIQDGGVTIAALAPLASPTFTGTPAAPTAAQGTSSTQVATTAFATKSGLRPRLPGAVGADFFRIGSNAALTLGRIFWVPMPVFDIDVKATNAWIDLVTGQASCFATMALTGCVSATNDAPGARLASTSVGGVDLTSASPQVRGAAFTSAYTIPAGTRTWMQVIALGGTAPTSRGIDGWACGMPAGTPASAPVTPTTFGTFSAYLLSSQSALVDTPTITGLTPGIGPVVYMSIEAP